MCICELSVKMLKSWFLCKNEFLRLTYRNTKNGSQLIATHCSRQVCLSQIVTCDKWIVVACDKWTYRKQLPATSGPLVLRCLRQVACSLSLFLATSAYLIDIFFRFYLCSCCVCWSVCLCSLFRSDQNLIKFSNSDSWYDVTAHQIPCPWFIFDIFDISDIMRNHHKWLPKSLILQDI